MEGVKYSVMMDDGDLEECFRVVAENLTLIEAINLRAQYDDDYEVFIIVDI